jgi:hypothetical protein
MFKCGQRVRARVGDGPIEKGWRGTVAKDSEVSIPVDWNKLVHGHSCKLPTTKGKRFVKGKCREKHGWFYYEMDLEAI